MMQRLLAVLLLASPALGQEGPPTLQCQPHDQMIEQLQTQYAETVMGGGRNGSVLLEITTSLKGTWTIIVTDLTTGQTCPKAAGANWKTIKLPGVET